MRILALPILFLALTAQATDYYISSSVGNDAWSGTLAEPNGEGDGPKASTSAADTLLDTVMVPGDRVFFRRGDTWTGVAPAMSLSTATGALGNHLIVGAYGTGEMPKFDYSSTNDTAIIHFEASGPTGSASYITFENLHLTTTSAPGSRPSGLRTSGYNGNPVSHHIVMSGMLMDGMQGALSMYSTDVTIENSVFRQNYKYPEQGEDGHSQGMWGHTLTNLIVRNSIFDRNGKYNSVFDHDMYISGSQNALIENNLITGYDGIKLRKTSNVTVRNNRFINLTQGAIGLGSDTESLPNGSYDTLIEYNYFEDVWHGISLSNASSTDPSDPGIDGVTIRYNTFRNRKMWPGAFSGGSSPWITTPASGSIGFDYPAKNITVEYNTFCWLTNRPKGSDVIAFYPTLWPTHATETTTFQHNVMHRWDPGKTQGLIVLDANDGSVTYDYNTYSVPAQGYVASARSGAGSPYVNLAAFHVAYPAVDPNATEVSGIPPECRPAVTGASSSGGSF